MVKWWNKVIKKQIINKTTPKNNNSKFINKNELSKCLGKRKKNHYGAKHAAAAR